MNVNHTMQNMDIYSAKLLKINCNKAKYRNKAKYHNKAKYRNKAKIVTKLNIVTRLNSMTSTI
jgi:hypothetical protein